VRGGRLIRLSLALLLALAIGLVAPAIASAGPVNWQELPATADGRQWWDAGSLRRATQRLKPLAPVPATST